MKLVCELNDRLTTINYIDKPTWSALYPEDMVGVPVFAYEEALGPLYLWPKPIPECKIYRLEEQSYFK